MPLSFNKGVLIKLVCLANYTVQPMNNGVKS
uniref:Uncharacterized protein n=1 Tax=Arundo donax TaxID=35708 RepID=A0A0A9H4H0_ARUDO